MDAFVSVRGGQLKKQTVRVLLEPIMSMLEPRMNEILMLAFEEGRKAEKVRYTNASEVTLEQREAAAKSDLFNKGDMVLVWVNEGDILRYGEKTN